MNKYKLENGLYSTKADLFECDEKAWNNLRLELPNRYATLYKQVETEVPYNNSIEYTTNWNSKYGPPPIGHGSDSAELKDPNIKNIYHVWIPILEGITSHEYNID